jgi:molecular chaperone DnaK
MIVSRAVGIDLGTTNSAVAMLMSDDRELLLSKDAQGRTTTPSCVWSDRAGKQVVVGHAAYARRGLNPAPITSIKRAMGTQTTIRVGSRTCTLSDVSALILRELLGQIEATVKAREGPDRYRIGPAIVTVPAYFDLPAIEATREAGRAAGLEVLELLHEPTAAAIYYGWRYALPDGVYLVYDLGGGTFDVSILRRTAGEYLVLGIGGDSFLGGDELDRRLARHLAQRLAADGYDLDPSPTDEAEDQRRFRQLVTLAERTKIALSDAPGFVLRDSGTIRDRSGEPIQIELTIDRATFDGLVDDLVERSLVATAEALAKATERSGITIADVDQVLLVGGSTHVPAVAERVRCALCAGGGDDGPRARCSEPLRHDPDTVVALGAALRAGSCGVALEDDDHHVRVHLRGSAVTRRDSTRIGGHVEKIRDGPELAGGRITALRAGGELAGEADLDGALRFSLPALALTPETTHRFELVVSAADGTVMARLSRDVARDEQAPEPAGRTLATAVLAKAILLDGAAGDDLVRHVLLAEGTSLPARADFTFKAGESGHEIRLPIYQHHHIIKELRLDVGAVRAGTPVDVTIVCDEQVNIAVEVTAGGRTFQASIDPPPPETPPSEADVSRIDAAFEEAAEELLPGDAARLRATYAATRADLAEARSDRDVPKVIHRAADLAGLVKAARGARPLQPLLEEVEGRVTACRKLLAVARQSAPAMTQSLREGDFDAFETRARTAFGARDTERYAEVVAAVESAHDLLAGVVHACSSSADDCALELPVRATLAVQQVRQLHLQLFVHAMQAGSDDLAETLGARFPEIETLTERARTRPDEVLVRCQQLRAEAMRLHRQLAPETGREELSGLLQMPRGGRGTLDMPG